MKKIFISHSHLDKFFAEKIIDILEKIGVASSKIICTSVEGYGIPLGEDFLNKIKTWLNDDVLVIFLLSKNYYSSPISLCEMGASWISAKKVIPILIPPLTFEDFKGVFQQHISFYINDRYQLSIFKEQIEEEFQIREKTRDLLWEKFKDKMLKELNSQIIPKNKTFDKKTISANSNSNSREKPIRNSEEIILKKETIIKGNEESHTENIDSINIPQFVSIKAGEFILGNNKFGQLKIRLTKDFLFSQHLVTQELFEQTIGYNNSFFKGSKLPVENVNWLEAITFCNSLSEKCGLSKYYIIDGMIIKTNIENNGFRLPTEAEWEYVCLNQNNNEEVATIGDIAWYSLNSGQKTHEVGQKLPNAIEIHDLLGNVWEWCFDDYINYSGSSDTTIEDRMVSKGSNKKVVRGGSYASTSNIVNAKQRDKRDYKYKSKDLGFRILKNI